MQYDTTLDRDVLGRMLASLRPEWRLGAATPVDVGRNPVYRLCARTARGTRTDYLKATPLAERANPSIGAEARLLAALDAHTPIPVPSVVGAVDESSDLPAPFVLLEAMPGEAHSRAELDALSDGRLRTIARETGRYLGVLHSLDAVDSFGELTWSGPELCGGRPAGRLGGLSVVGPVDSWQAALRRRAERTFDRLEETRFADVIGEAEPVLDAGIADVTESDPVLARIDNSLDHVLLSGGEVTGLLDWELTEAATPTYDLLTVSWGLAGGPYRFAPGVPDRRRLIRRVLFEGYRDAGAERVPDRTCADRDCHGLLLTLHTMAHLETWYEAFGPDEQLEDAAAAIRAELRTWL